MGLRCRDPRLLLALRSVMTMIFGTRLVWCWRCHSGQQTLSNVDWRQLCWAASCGAGCHVVGGGLSHKAAWNFIKRTATPHPVSFLLTSGAEWVYGWREVVKPGPGKGEGWEEGIFKTLAFSLCVLPWFNLWLFVSVFLLNKLDLSTPPVPSLPTTPPTPPCSPVPVSLPMAIGGVLALHLSLLGPLSTGFIFLPWRR